MLVRIQHHPARAELLPKLIESLAPLVVEVSTHSSDPPNPWHGYRQALTDLPDDGHVVVLQDDVEVCRNFAPAMAAIADANPETPVVLFLAKLPPHIAGAALRAAKRKRSYVRMRLRSSDFMPVVGVLWPCHKANEFLAWASSAKLPGYPRETRSDDAVAGRWAMKTRLEIAFTVPSLVEHRDQVPSLIGKRARWGRDSTRVALLFEQGDPLERDWSR